jgi:Zn-dependent peptidase ImmA (M78 family)
MYLKMEIKLIYKKDVIMPLKSFEVDINPNILIWARETIGRSTEEVANRLGVGEHIVIKWESGDKKPTLKQLKILSTYYKRSLAVFYLPKPPEETPLPKDFRTLPGEEKISLSPKTRLAIRRARRIQSLTKELEGYFQTDFYKVMGKVRLSDDPENVAKKIRKIVNVSLEEQYRWKKDTEALKYWIKSIESLGVLVIQLPMRLEEARAFSMVGGKTPMIVLNTKDQTRARIFSLFHELCHLTLNKEGICDPVRGGTWEFRDTKRPSGEIINTEIFCNYFAGAFLVPKESLIEHGLVIDVYKPKKWDKRELARIANTYWVSKEVVLRRLLIIGKTTKNYYQMKREEWESLDSQKADGGGGRGRDRPGECIKQNGAPFVSLVLNSYKEDRITSSDVADYLEIRLKYLPKVEKMVGAGA